VRAFLLPQESEAAMSTRQRDASGRFVKGQSLGTATATIVLAADKFEAGAKIVHQASAQTGKAVEGIGGAADKAQVSLSKFPGIGTRIQQSMKGVSDGIDRARASMKAFDNSSLGKIQGAIKGIRDQIALVSVAAAGLAGFGLAQAREMARVNTQFTVLIGNQKLANQEQAKLVKFAQEYSMAESEVLKAGAGMLPLMKATGAEMGKLILNATKLAALDPMQGFEGAQTAIREFVAGDVTSLYRRFELGVSKEQYKKIYEEAHGDVNVMLDLLNELISKTGLTDEALKKINEADPFPVLVDNLKMALAEGFTPLLQALVPIAKDFAKWLKDIREHNPDLLKFGAGLTVAVAAGAPLLTFLSTAISLFKGLKAAGAALNLGGVLGKVGGVAKALAPGAIAVAGGVALGTAGATALANAGVQGGDLQRIRNGEKALDILGERLKQIALIIYDRLLDVVGVFAKAGIQIQFVLTRLADVFTIGVSLVSEMFGNLKVALGSVIEGLGSFIDSVAGSVTNEGIRLQGIGMQARLEGGDQVAFAQQARDAALKNIEAVMPSPEQIESMWQEQKATLWKAAEEFFFPSRVVGKGIEQIAQSVEKAAQVIGDSPEYLAQQAEEIAAVQQKYNEEEAAAERKQQEDLIKINKEYADDLIKIAQDRVKAEAAALASLNDDLAKMNTERGRDEEKTEREKGRKALELAIKLQRDELADAQDHADKLIKIRKDYEEKERNALENFDFAALFDLSEELKSNTDEQNEEYEKQRQERLQALQYEREDLARNYAAEREERNIEFQNRLTDRQAEYEQERARIAVETAEKYTLAQQAHANELTDLANKYTTEQQLRQEAYRAQLADLMVSEQERARIMAEAQAALLAQAYGFMNGVRSGGSASTGSRNGSLPSQGGSQMPSPNPPRNNPAPAPNRDGGSSQNRGGTPNRHRVPGRAFGGPVLSGQTYLINEITPERFKRGAQMYELPNQTGYFTPIGDGTVAPGRGSDSKSQINVTVQLNAPIDSGILTLDQAIPLIQRAAQEGAETVLNDWMGNFAR
jgi:hypothetical protein